MAVPVSLLSDGLRLAAELHAPARRAPGPGLCICHGIPAVPYNPADSGYHDLAVRCANEGFATLLFNFRGAGLSEGDFDMRGWTRDLGVAIDYLLGVEAVDPSHLFLMGFSGGAAAAICRAAQDNRIAGVVSCASPADFEDLIQGQKLDDCLARWRQIGIVRDPLFPRDMAEWAAGFRDVAPVNHIARISPCPILILHGDEDDVVPVSHAHRLFAAAREPKWLSIIPDGLHRLRVNEQAMAIALDWLRARSSG